MILRLLILVGFFGFVLLFFAVAAALVLPLFTDWKSYQPQMLQAFSDHTGLQLEVEGDINFTLFPRPRLTVEGGTIKNNPPSGVGLSFQETSDNILQAQRIDAYLDIVPLALGKLDVHLRLVNPVLNIERYDDEELPYNISPLILALQQRNAGVNQSISSEEAREIGSFALKGVEIENGQISFRDLKTNKAHNWQITEGLAAIDLGYGTLKADGTLNRELVLYDYSITASPSGSSKTQFNSQGIFARHADTASSLGTYSLILEYTGFLSFATEPKIVVRTEAVERFEPLSGGGAESAVPLSYWTKAEVEATWGVVPSVAVRDLAFGFGEGEAESSALLEGSGLLEWHRDTGKLVLTSDLRGGAWQTGEVQGLMAFAGRFGGAQGAGQQATGPPGGGASGFLDGLDASMKFSLEALSYRGVTTRHLRAVLRNEGKDLLIENLSLGFAGDTTFTTRGRLNPARFGVADAETEAPEAFFVADASFNAGDLPALLASLTGEARAGGAATSPAKGRGVVRLYREANGEISAQMRAVNLSLAGSRAVADLDWRDKIFAADIRAERIDLDGLAETFAGLGGKLGDSASSASSATPSSAPAPSVALLVTAEQVFRDKHRFDDLVLRADYRGITEKKWRVERLEGRYSGWQVSARGNLSRTGNLSGNLWALADGGFSASIEEGQLRQAGAVVGLSAKRAEVLRGANIKSTLAGSLDELALNATASFGYGLEVVVEGTAQLLADANHTREPRLNLRGQINAPDIRPVMQVWADGKEVPFLRGVLTSDLTFQGGVKNGTAEILGARIGTFPFNGAISWQGQEQARTWQARLRGGRLDMNRRELLETPQAKIPFARRVQNFSRRPFGFRFDKNLALDLNLELDSLLLGKETFLKPRAKLSFKDGDLTLSQVNFAWQNATLSGDATLQPDPASAVKANLGINLKVENLALEPILRERFDFTRARGTVSLAGKFAGDATSPYGLAQSLAGAWQVTGAVRYTPEKEEKIASLVSALLQEKLQQLPSLKTYSDALNFTLANFADRDGGLQASGRLDKLALSVQEGTIKNDRALLAFAGTAADFSDSTLNLTADVFEEQQEEPSYKISVSGALAKPKVELKATGSPRTEAPSATDGESAQAPPVSEQSAAETAEEVIKGVLDQILGEVLNP